LSGQLYLVKSESGQTAISVGFITANHAVINNSTAMIARYGSHFGHVAQSPAHRVIDSPLNPWKICPDNMGHSA
jgi:hypothetical protein